MSESRSQYICSVGGCDKEHKARGYCMNHWYQAKRAGEFVPAAKRQRHHLENLDMELRIADCDLCGPGVAVVWPGNPTCRERAREISSSKNGKRKGSPEQMLRMAEHQRNYRWRRNGASLSRECVVEAEGWRCAICRCALTEKEARIDHDHSCCPSGRFCDNCIRGALCHGCNVGLGSFGDDPSRILAALDYLAVRSISTRNQPRMEEIGATKNEE